MTGAPPDGWRLRVSRPYQPERATYDGYLDDIFERNWLTNGGPCEAALAERLKARFDTARLQLVSSGTSALQLALAALDLEGDLIVTPYSFAATRNAVLRQGCRPVYADIDPVTFALDPAAIERVMTPATSAILVTSAYGLPCDFDDIQQIADAHSIPTIYDHAHATGSVYRGRAMPTYGDLGALSFHATKVFHTIEGGAVISHSPGLDDKLRLMKANGIDGDTIPHAGFNAKMSEVHAAMGLAILPDLDALIAARKRIFELYVEALGNAPARLPDPAAFGDFRWNYAYAPMILESGDTTMRVQRALAARGIESRRYFRPAFSSAESSAACPVAEDLTERVLCLPLGPHVDAEHVDEIGAIVRANV